MILGYFFECVMLQEVTIKSKRVKLKSNRVTFKSNVVIL